MKKIIITLILGIFFLFAGIGVFTSQPDTETNLDTAVYVGDGKVNSENEGKIVILSGKLEPEYPFVDPATGVTIPYPAAERRVQVFRYEVGSDDEYYWDPIIYSGTNTNKGVNLNKFTTSTLIPPTRLGDFYIDPRILLNLEINKNWNEVSEKDLGSQNFYIYKDKDDRTTYVSEMPGLQDNYETYQGINWKKEVGRKRCSYQVYDDKKTLDYTIIGVQKGDRLMIKDDLGVSFLQEGIHDGDEFKSSKMKENNIVGTVGIVLGLGCLGLATKFIKKRKKEKEA